MIRCYGVKSFENNVKTNKIKSLIFEYRKTAIVSARDQWDLFYKTGKFNKFGAFQDINTDLSARYIQTIRGQVVSQLEGYTSNLVNYIKKLIGKSNLLPKKKERLFIINKYKMWFYKPQSLLKSRFTLTIEDLRLSKKLYKQALKINRKPNFNKCNMVLDSKVCEVKVRETSKNKKAKSYDIWLRLSTIEKGKPVYIPVKLNKYINSKKGLLKKIVQINEIKGNIKINLVKDVRKRSYKKSNTKLGIDLGFKSFLYTNKGDMFGKSFIEKLKSYSLKINKLRSARNKCGLKYSTGRLERLENKLRNLIKNEVSRIINRILHIHKPSEIIIENLDFRGSKLNRNMNRLLNRFGKSILRNKLESIKEEFGIKIIEVNPAYTSQTCSSCGFVSKNNRNGSKFECKYCGKKINSDINASRNILNRSSIEGLKGIYVKKNKILSILLGEFRERNRIKTRLNSWSEVSSPKHRQSLKRNVL